MSCPLVTDSIQLHLVRPRPFAGQQRFALKIGVNHDDGSGIVVQITDDSGHRGKSGDLACMMSPVTSNNLISAFFPWAHDGGNQYAMFPDALSGIQHLLIIQHFEWMILEWVHLCQWQFYDPFPAGIGSAFL